MTGSGPIDAQRAFDRAARARRFGALRRLVARAPAERGRLPVYDERALQGSSARPARGIREIRLEAIEGTLEPIKAVQFDRDFRPAASARRRWERVWLAEHSGAPLPPISVVPMGAGYAVRDGHHRVSVARARGALTIDAHVDGAHA